jgi:hypothetical protein
VRLHVTLTILAVLLLAAPARADNSAQLGAAVGGGFLVVGYGGQALAASSMSSDGSKVGYIPVAGALKLMTQFIRMDCSRSPEGYCDVARVLVPMLLGVDLAFEMAGLGLLTYGAALAAKRRTEAARARTAWAPFVSARGGAALVGVAGRF